MTDVMEVLTVDDEGNALFVFQDITDPKYRDHCLDVRIFEVEGWLLDGTPHETSPYMSAYIKWDGCANFDFPDDVCVHMCGRGSAESHCAAVMAVFDLAESRIKRYDKQVAE